MVIHPSITEGRIMDACERRMTTLDDPGFCLACGNEQGGCEPDARRYQCEACGEFQVYGAEELALLEIAIEYHTKEEDGE
jgi:Zn finger protein HypA/HybF involved in hydrogenase expression